MHHFEVEAPAGGKIFLRSQDEVEFWEDMVEGYKEDYNLTRRNELVLVGALVTQALTIYRGQQEMTGLLPKFDNSGIPTGEMEEKKVSATERGAIQKSIAEASKEIRELEKQLGIDKKSREASGAQTVAGYISTLKEAGHKMGVHIFQRVKMYEQLAMDLRWRLRILRNGDDEDKRYHDISPEKICKWAEGVLAEIEKFDQEFAEEQQKLFGGKL